MMLSSTTGKHTSWQPRCSFLRLLLHTLLVWRVDGFSPRSSPETCQSTSASIVSRLRTAHLPRRPSFSPHCQYVHSSVVSPFISSSPSQQLNQSPPFEESLGALKDEFDKENNTGGTSGNGKREISNVLDDLCQYLQAEPTDMIRLDTTEDDGVRGVYLNHPVQRGDIIISIPLKSCLVDAKIPAWMEEFERETATPDDDEESYSNPSQWATRLAASLIDLQLRQKRHQEVEEADATATTKDSVNPGHELWLSMLPDPEFLKASLPVHWPEETIQHARCTALELAVDTSYFARAQATEDLVWAIKGYFPNDDDDESPSTPILDQDELRQLCSNALDVVQTRSCRLQPSNGVKMDSTEDAGSAAVDSSPPFRVLAPIFDMINHGSTKTLGPSSANAEFGMISNANDRHTPGDTTDVELEDSLLVVRATRDLEAGEEVLIDYGESTIPAWKCLMSYGFVPEYCRKQSKKTKEPGDEDENNEVDDSAYCIPPGGEDVEGSYNEEMEDINIAELYMEGVRYEVGPSSIPVHMVASAIASLREEGQQEQFTSKTAARAIPPAIAKNDPIADDEANSIEEPIVLTPEVALRLAERISEAAYYLLLEPEHDMYDDHPAALPTAFQVISTQLAASLRWSQHRVLLACASGLRDAAKSDA